jgi:hypothetical protein
MGKTGGFGKNDDGSGKFRVFKDSEVQKSLEILGIRIFGGYPSSAAKIAL